MQLNYYLNEKIKIKTRKFQFFTLSEFCPGTVLGQKLDFFFLTICPGTVPGQNFGDKPGTGQFGDKPGMTIVS